MISSMVPPSLGQFTESERTMSARRMTRTCGGLEILVVRKTPEDVANADEGARSWILVQSKWLVMLY